MVATKDSELPMRAHLRGAVALINERKSKSMEQAPSTQVSHMLEAQIVCTFWNKFSLWSPTKYLLDQKFSIIGQPFGFNSRYLATSEATRLIAENSAHIDCLGNSAITTGLGKYCKHHLWRIPGWRNTSQSKCNWHQPSGLDILSSRTLDSCRSHYNSRISTHGRDVSQSLRLLYRHMDCGDMEYVPWLPYPSSKDHATMSIHDSFTWSRRKKNSRHHAYYS